MKSWQGKFKCYSLNNWQSSQKENIAKENFQCSLHIQFLQLWVTMSLEGHVAACAVWNIVDYSKRFWSTPRASMNSNANSWGICDFGQCSPLLKHPVHCSISSEHIAMRMSSHHKWAWTKPKAPPLRCVCYKLWLSFTVQRKCFDLIEL